MIFKLEEAIEILERTPRTLEQLLTGISPGWLYTDEGEGTWTPEEVVEHLIEAEKTNWIPRMELILKEGEGKPFPEFDRFAHLNKKNERSVEAMFIEFKAIRHQNIATLREVINSDVILERTGVHPAFGSVKVRELLSTWVVHDLTHISQIVRVMANRYREDVGPWAAYLSIIKK